MSVEWYLKSPKYFGGKEKNIIQDSAQAGFLELLEYSPESYDVEINSVPAKIIVQSLKATEDAMKIKAEIGNIQIGDTILHKKKKWLITSFVNDNTMHAFSVMEMCKSNIVIQGKPVKTKIGNDPSGKPIYEMHSERFSFPCVVTNTLTLNTLNNDVNLPTGMVVAKMSYVDDLPLEVNDICELMGRQYKVADIDLINTFEEEGQRIGIIQVLAQKVQQGQG